MKSHLALLALLALSAPAGAGELFSSFEFTNLGNFTLGNAPLSATFTGGQAKSVGVPGLYHSGFFSWMVSAQGAGFVNFGQPLQGVDFWYRDESNSVKSQVLVCDPNFNVLATFNGSTSWTHVQFTGTIGQIDVLNLTPSSTAHAVIDDFKAIFGTTLTYCTAKSGLACGTPAIAFSGQSSATAVSGFTISAAPARSNRTGILLYTSSGRANLAFPAGGHILCIATSPLRRGGPTSSGGTPGPNCDGVFTIDWNAFAHGVWAPPGGQAANNPAPFLVSAGQVVNVQWWGRDSLATGSFMSDALEYTVCP
jgi:hypothetical protein